MGLQFISLNQTSHLLSPLSEMTHGELDICIFPKATITVYKIGMVLYMCAMEGICCVSTMT